VDIEVTSFAQPVDFERLGIISVMSFDAPYDAAPLAGFRLYNFAVTHRIAESNVRGELLGIAPHPGFLRPLNCWRVLGLIGHASGDSVRKTVTLIVISSNLFQVGYAMRLNASFDAFLAVVKIA
jgi:hypothetical protein